MHTLEQRLSAFWSHLHTQNLNTLHEIVAEQPQVFSSESMLQITALPFSLIEPLSHFMCKTLAFHFKPKDIYHPTKTAILGDICEFLA